jgi:hypothetical protein
MYDISGASCRANGLAKVPFLQHCHCVKSLTGISHPPPWWQFDPAETHSRLPPVAVVKNHRRGPGSQAISNRDLLSLPFPILAMESQLFFAVLTIFEGTILNI